MDDGEGVMTDQASIRKFGAAMLALLLVAAQGCTGINPVPPPKPGAYAPYRVGAPDTLGVTILPEPAIERTVTVRPDGMISLDLIGDVPAAGRMIDEIAADIEQRISRFKRDANVTVTLDQAMSTAVTVFGEVRGPSSFPLLKETRIAEAIGMVSGETLFATTSKIRVVRSGGGETVVYLVSLNAIRKGDLSTNMVLVPGDIVYVPPNIFARIGYAINTVLFPFQPFMGLFTSAVGSYIGVGR
jgi:polysaccharide export outer membrane protein